MSTFENTDDKHNIKPIIHYSNEQIEEYLRNPDMLCNIIFSVGINSIAVSPI